MSSKNGDGIKHSDKPACECEHMPIIRQAGRTISVSNIKMKKAVDDMRKITKHIMVMQVEEWEREQAI